MKCPQCGIDTIRHGTYEILNCELSEDEALVLAKNRAAQRHAAAENLWRMKRTANELLRGRGVLAPDTGRTLLMAITGYQLALRDCGIQRPRPERVEVTACYTDPAVLALTAACIVMAFVGGWLVRDLFPKG